MADEVNVVEIAFQKWYNNPTDVNRMALDVTLDAHTCSCMHTHTHHADCIFCNDDELRIIPALLKQQGMV